MVDFDESRCAQIAKEVAESGLVSCTNNVVSFQLPVMCQGETYGQHVALNGDTLLFSGS